MVLISNASGPGQSKGPPPSPVRKKKLSKNISRVWVGLRVSNGTGQPYLAGQRDRSFYIVSGQRDNRTSSKFCHGTGSSHGKMSKSCPVPWQNVKTKSRPVPWQDFELVPGQCRNFCPFVPRGKTVPSRWKP